MVGAEEEAEGRGERLMALGGKSINLTRYSLGVNAVPIILFEECLRASSLYQQPQHSSRSL